MMNFTYYSKAMVTLSGDLVPSDCSGKLGRDINQYKLP